MAWPDGNEPFPWAPYWKKDPASGFDGRTRAAAAFSTSIQIPASRSDSAARLDASASRSSCAWRALKYVMPRTSAIGRSVPDPREDVGRVLHARRGAARDLDLPVEVLAAVVPASRLDREGDPCPERPGEERILDLLRPPFRNEELLVRDHPLEEVGPPVRPLLVGGRVRGAEGHDREDEERVPGGPHRHR
jgi:hypothetical protein